MKKAFIHWLETTHWPWTIFAALRKEISDLKASLVRNQLDFSDGYNRHFNDWLAKANQLYGSRLFDERERPVMRRLYEDGYNYVEALDLLKEAFGYGRYSFQLPTYRRK